MKPSTKNTIKRALVSIAVFAAIYLLSGPIIGWTGYDMNLASSFCLPWSAPAAIGSEVTKDNAVFAEILQKHCL